MVVQSGYREIAELLLGSSAVLMLGISVGASISQRISHLRRLALSMPYLFPVH